MLVLLLAAFSDSSSLIRYFSIFISTRTYDNQWSVGKLEVTSNGSASAVQRFVSQSYEDCDRGRACDYEVSVADSALYLQQQSSRSQREGMINRIFVVGNQRSCDGIPRFHCNGPLAPETTYTLALRAYTYRGYMTIGPVTKTTSSSSEGHASMGHPDKVIISPSSRLSVAKGENFECGVVGGRSNISLKWTVNVEEIRQESLYTNSQLLEPRRSRLTLTRAADWVTLRLGCEAVSTVNKDSKTLKASVPPLLIRPADFPDKIDVRMSSLIRSFKRMFGPKNSFNCKVDNTTGGSVDRPKSAPKNSLNKKVDNNTESSVDRPKSVPKNFFIWKVDNFVGGGTDRSSPKFFSHSGGYRMQINFDTPDSRSYIWLYFRLWKGENDPNLSWPFKGNVTMSVVDQRDNSNAYSVSAQYDSMNDYGKIWECRRPSDSHNWWIHLGKIDRSSFTDPASGIIRNGAIVIQCEVTFPN